MIVKLSLLSFGILAALGATLTVAFLADPHAGHTAFPGANGKIAFHRFLSSTNTDIFVINPDGSGVTNLTNSLGEMEFSPVWSPDGTKIAFERRGTDSSHPGEIYVMNADGSGQTNITNHAAWDSSPTWSADGTKIAFGSSRDGVNFSEIFVMNADGSDVRQLTDEPHWETVSSGPVWSPDGTKIAFTKGSVTTPSDICLMNADGSAQMNLTSDLEFDESPDWSPDGSKITFASQRSGILQVYVMNADGSGVTQLSPEFALSPVWSPDGTKIAFDSFTALRPSTIFVMNADGTGLTELSALGDGSPDWQPLVPSALPTPAPSALLTTTSGCTPVLRQYQPPGPGPAPPVLPHDLPGTGGAPANPASTVSILRAVVVGSALLAVVGLTVLRVPKSQH